MDLETSNLSPASISTLDISLEKVDWGGILDNETNPNLSIATPRSEFDVVKELTEKAFSCSLFHSFTQFPCDVYTVNSHKLENSQAMEGILQYPLASAQEVDQHIRNLELVEECISKTHTNNLHSSCSIGCGLTAQEDTSIDHSHSNIRSATTAEATPTNCQNSPTVPMTPSTLTSMASSSSTQVDPCSMNVPTHILSAPTDQTGVSNWKHSTVHTILSNPFTPGTTGSASTAQRETINVKGFIDFAGIDEGRKERRPAYFPNASPSTFCHICGRRPNSSQTERPWHAMCVNLKRGICRKVVCKLCFAKHAMGNFAKACDENSDWKCCHCSSRCPPKAQCMKYRKVNENIRRRRALGFGMLPKKTC